MRTLHLHFEGPFGWGRDKSIPCMFSKGNKSLISKGGVYLWTALTGGNEETVLYVGETTNFRRRFKEHKGEQSIGWYRVHDPVALGRGEAVLIWEGAYGNPGIEIDADFMSRFEERRESVTRYNDILRFHLAAVSPDEIGEMKMTEFLQRVEAGLAYHFYNRTETASQFQDSRVQYLEQSTLGRKTLSQLEWPPEDSTIQLTFHTNAKIRAFPRPGEIRI